MNKYFSRLWILFPLIFLLLNTGEKPSWGKPIDIWVIGDSYKVDPLDGSVLGIDWKGSEDYKNKNMQWDGIEKRIFLRGSKNEVLSFQIIIERKDESINNILIKKKRIKGPITKSNPIFHFFLEGYSDIGDNDKWIPDLLIPFHISGIHPFSIPQRIDPLPEIPDQKNQGIWVDVAIPAKAERGIYIYELIFTTADNEKEKILVELEVINLLLPLRYSFGIDLNDYGPKYLDDWHKLENEKELYSIEKEFYRMAHSHGAVLNILPYKSQLGFPWPGITPEIDGIGRGKRVTNWKVYDKRMGPYFDGSAFDNGIPLSHHYLPFNPEWPSDFSLYFSNRERYEAEWMAIANEFMDHAKQKKWNQTIFQIYLNQKPQKNNRIPWRLDEPQGIEDYKALRYFADLTHRFFKGPNSDRFKFRMDISHFFCDEHQGDINKDLRKNGGFDILFPIDIWAVSTHSLPSPVASRKARDLQNERKQIWQYGNAPLIEHSLFRVHEKIWQGYVEKWNGILFWKSITRNLNQGDGKKFLIYSGAPLKIKGPLPSMRLKALRRGMYDYQYMSMIENLNPEKREWIELLVQPRSPEDYTKVRGNLQKEALDIVSK